MICPVVVRLIPGCTSVAPSDWRSPRLSQYPGYLLQQDPILLPSAPPPCVSRVPPDPAPAPPSPSLGSFLAMARKMSLTFRAVLAEEEKSVLLSVGRGLVILHYPVGGQICLISRQSYDYVRTGLELIINQSVTRHSLYLSLQFLHPGLGSLEGVGVGDIVDHDGGLGPPVVHGRQGVISLLARRVPDLELDCRVVQTDGLGQKCSSNGGLENNRLDSPSSGVPSLPAYLLKFMKLSLHKPQN